MKVGVEGFICAVATEERHDVGTRESATTSESKDGGELFGRRAETHVKDAHVKNMKISN